MTKFLNKWMRVLHRWIAVPTVIIIPLAVISKFSGGTGGHLPLPLEQLQSILMLLLVITGSYLYLVPYLAKWQRARRARARADAARLPERAAPPSPTAFPSRRRNPSTDSLNAPLPARPQDSL